MPLVKIHRRVGHPAAQNEQIMAANGAVKMRVI